MAYSTPRTWVADEYPTAAQLNANVRDNISFLANPPACRVSNAVQSIPHGANAIVTWNSEEFDTDTMHSNVTNNDRITFTTAGLYVVTMHGAFEAATNYVSLRAEIFLNAAGYIAGGSDVGSLNSSGFSASVAVTTIRKFAAGDYIRANILQVNGSSAAKNWVAGGFFSAVRVGIG